MHLALRSSFVLFFGLVQVGFGADDDKAAKPYYVRSAASGKWSDGATWNGGHAPKVGDRVYIAREHEVMYDVDSADVIRSIHLDGVLRFAGDQNTRLETG